jgi:hypothetical protein
MAPKLRYCNKVGIRNGDPSYGHLRMIVMDFVDGDSLVKQSRRHFMITQLFLPFLFFKVVAFDPLTLEHNSATHDVVGVVHGIFLLDFSFEV